MKDWVIYSSEDLINWKFESSFSPEETYIGSSNEWWAVDAC